ncbi:hypothetical protein JST97_23310 [bacterium]|nr:hypothetical protein [bacterium]
MLELLRNRASTSELSREQTLQRILAQMSETGRFESLMKVAMTESRRVRAMLGTIGQQLNRPGKHLQLLRASLNPITRYNFGALAGLPQARQWKAR